LESGSLKAFFRQSFRIFDFSNLASHSRYFLSVTLKILRIQPADTTVTLSLTMPQEIIKLSSNRQWVSRNRKSSRKLWARWKDEEIPLLLSKCDTGNPKVSVVFQFSERSSRSDSSSPKCIDIKLPKWGKGRVML